MTSSGTGGWLTLIVIVVGAVGAGVTGTLLWMESRPQKTTESQTAPQPAAPMALPQSEIPLGAPSPSTNNSQADNLHEPPPGLTANLTPPQAALMRGNWYYDHERWDVAISEYQKALKGGIDNPNVRTDLGNCFRFVDKPQQALEQYKIAQKQNPLHEQSLFNQGGLFAFSMHQPEKAIAVWQDYLKRFPKGKSVAEAKKLIARVKANPNEATGAKD